MIDWLVNRLFWWTPLRNAIFTEVHMYDQLDKIIKDGNPGSAYWNDGDGWRSWTYSEKFNKYYFNDIPEDELVNAITYSYQSLPEFDVDEVW